MPSPARRHPVKLTKYVPVREGFAFTGWYAGEALTELVTEVKLKKNTTVYAGWQWINLFSVDSKSP